MMEKTKCNGLSFIAALIIAFFLCIFNVIVRASDEETAISSETAHIDLGESYSTYTVFDGLLIEPQWKPYVALHYERGDIVADTQTGAGYKLLNSSRFNGGLAIAYQYGRHAAADTRYRNLGDVASSWAPSVFAEYTAFGGGLDIYAETGKSVAATHSIYATIETTIAVPLVPSTDGFFDLLLVGGDSRYTRAFYGVSPGQSDRSDYAEYRPSSGVTTATSVIGASVKLAPRWRLIADIGIENYIDAAARSPLVDRHKQAVGNIWLSYRF